MVKNGSSKGKGKRKQRYLCRNSDCRRTFYKKSCNPETKANISSDDSCLKCPHCNSSKVGKHGTSKGKGKGERKQRYLCRNSDCGRTFYEKDGKRSCNPEVKLDIPSGDTVIVSIDPITHRLEIKADKADISSGDSYLQCPRCDSRKVVKNGTSKHTKGKKRKQRYICRNPDCRQKGQVSPSGGTVKTFYKEYTHIIRNPMVKKEILKSFKEGATIQMISMLYKISEDMVVTELKKNIEW